MVERLRVPEPPLGEQLRRLAAAVADLYYVMEIVVENAKELAPGEAVDELTDAWATSRTSMKALVENIFPTDANVRGDMLHALEVPTHPKPAQVPDLSKSELLGETGRAKTSMLARLKDGFMMYWNSEPRTDEKRLKARDALCDYFELGSTVVNSIPGSDQVVEFLSLTKQLVAIRNKRGI